MISQWKIWGVKTVMLSEQKNHCNAPLSHLSFATLIPSIFYILFLDTFDIIIYLAT